MVEFELETSASGLNEYFLNWAFGTIRNNNRKMLENWTVDPHDFTPSILTSIDIIIHCSSEAGYRPL